METKIKFKDGTEIEVMSNGNCFIVEEEPEFPEDLSEVIVDEDGDEKTLVNVTVQECAHIDDNYWFILIEETAQERIIRELREENAMLEDAILELAEIIGGAE